MTRKESREARKQWEEKCRRLDEEDPSRVEYVQYDRHHLEIFRLKQPMSLSRLLMTFAKPDRTYSCRSELEIVRALHGWELKRYPIPDDNVLARAQCSELWLVCQYCSCIEVSGAIECYFRKHSEKHHGFAIRNQTAWEFLRKKADDVKLIPEIQEFDPIHYFRRIGDPQEQNWQRKSMWRFQDEETTREILAAIQDDDDFRLKSEAVIEELYSGADATTKSIERAIGIVAEITEFNDEKGCHEMLPTWSAKLDEAVSVIRAIRESTSARDASMRKRLNSALNAANILRRCMPALVLHEIPLPLSSAQYEGTE